jgi:alginate O-acetyltransferase complex protein AlgI
LSSIIFFKYAKFIIDNINFIFETNIFSPQVVMPIGVSFYTFFSISYLIDVYRGTVSPQRNILFYGTYLSMFPHLIAGPIVRYATIEHEIVNRNENIFDFSEGLRRFIIGFCKKVLIANTMGTIADTILAADPGAIGAIPAWYAFIAYTFQIYFDFSGYSDMAIGLGRMFGFHFLENFNYPYISRSVTEFWRRWHISLSSFFRDYLYIPLGGNRVNSIQWILNILIVWMITGLWHGASWNFVCWGLYYGILLIGEKVLWGKLIQGSFRPIQHLYTIFVIIIGWVIFRIENFEQLGEWFFALSGFNGAGRIVDLDVMNVLQYYPWFIVAVVGSTPIFSIISRHQKESLIGGLVYDGVMLAFFVPAVISLAAGGFNPFIYFRF